MKTTRVLLTVLLGLASQPLLAQKVEIRWDDDYEYVDIDTFAWKHSDQREKDALIDQQIVKSINYQFTMQGMLQVALDEKPDVYVTYLLSVESGVMMTSAELGIDPATADSSVGLLLQRRPTYERGTLILQVRTAEGQVIFHGVASDTVSQDPGTNARWISRAVERMTRSFDQKIALAASVPSEFAGRPVTAINLGGHKVTKEHVIRREIRQGIDDPFDLATLQADKLRLQNLNIFASIDVDAEEDGEGVALDYEFKEMPPLIPFPAFTFTEENGFSYGLGVSALNFMGRDIQLSGRALFGGTTTYRLIFTYPWITGNHLSFDMFAAHLERADEVRGFEETSDEFTPWFGTYLGDHGRLAGTVSFFRMRSDVDGITIQPDNEDQLHRLGLRFGWDTRDSWRNPQRGWQNELQIFRTGGFLGGDGDFWTVDVDIRCFQPVNEKSTFAIGSLVTLQSGEPGVDVPSYFRYHLGGANTIRGYDIAQLGKSLSGKNQALGTLEYRYTLLPLKRWDLSRWSFNLGIELAAFGDLGFAWDESDEFSFRRFRGGGGFGIRLLVPGSEQTRFDIGFGGDGVFIHFGNWSKLSAQRFRLR